MKAIDQKLTHHFAGKIVRKDLTKLVKGNAIVPTYVLEYLLGQYCATDDEDTITNGVQTVRDIIARHFVHRDEAQYIKSQIRERGSHRIIDKVSVHLNDKRDVYEAQFINLGLSRVPISDEFIRQHKKLLSSGVWCIVTMAYIAAADEPNATPWVIESLKPIQIANADLEGYKEARAAFTKEEWVDVLMQSVGLNPDEFSFRSKLIQLARLIPFAENNYNLVELGPKGTGKSHIYSEMSPHGILISGGEVSKAKLFVNNSSGDIGLVGYWDVVTYDEFAGRDKRTDKGLVDILKNYMANKSFSRGTDVYGAAASMVFVGNTDHSVPYMLRHSNLFEALPRDYYDPAFLDRMHAYLPGWEVNKLRNEMFTADYGFNVDYLAEVLKELRKEDFTHTYKPYFDLSNSITTRDKDGISKTFSGLMKVIYPNGQCSEAEAQELMDFAIECRKRVKEQLVKLDETFETVDFSYQVRSTGQVMTVDTLETLQQTIATAMPEEASPANQPLADIADSSEHSSKLTLSPGQFVIRDNQTGVSFDNLFGPYLRGATEVILCDPFIRHPHQFRNLLEFVRTVARIKETDGEIVFYLVTNNTPEYLEESRKSLLELGDSLLPLGIDFKFEFNATIHDRSISLNNGWKIILGRGLDIYQKTSGRYDIAEFMPERRLCRACEISYLQINKL